MSLNRPEIDLINLRLGIDLESISTRGLPFHPEAAELVSIGFDLENREQRLTPEAAGAWEAMRAAAAGESIVLLPVSGFRSIDEQIAIVERKLGRGLPMPEILAGSAPPGFSEHHSGCAIDVGCPDSEVLSEAFETTSAYAWLTRNAGRFRFSLSFPRGNRYGYIFEPWHWFYRK